ncbi:MAG TPA: diaminopimelate epimerase [Chitinophagales bacterium]|nr:diaminopimelate epimerase [Chitinophagales bacterium]
MEFHKYHGNGNDFILIDNRKGIANLSSGKIAALCHRRFGVGADGLILLNKNSGFDFEMKYYNSDGNESTMCGNGGRCIIKFSRELGIIDERARFLAIDGPHEGIIEKNGMVMLKMNDVNSYQTAGDDFIINTGSPHYVKFVKNVDKVNVFAEGKRIRYQREFAKEGINVNFVEAVDLKFKVRTYERGVEDETLSCGTGVVAAALIGSMKLGKKEKKQTIHLDTPGGKFQVTFEKKNDTAFTNIWLTGGAEFVFKGEIQI